MPENIKQGGFFMERLYDNLTQEEYEMLTSELMVLEAEEKFNGKDNSIRIKEIKEAVIGQAPKCLECKEYHKNDYEKFSCEVYPDRIPYDIVDSERECKQFKPI